MATEESTNADADDVNALELLSSVPLGEPPLRESDLDSSSTRFEKLLAAPSDDDLQTMWTVWSSVFALYSAIILIIFLGIMSSRKVRRQSFNHYLIYLMLPDILYTCLCTIQCAVLAVRGGPNTPFSCRLQSFYLIFGNGANSWMNAIIAYQIHSLLKSSNRREKYSPPTRRQILGQAMAAYAFATFIALLGILPIPGIPIQTAPFYGLGCVAVSYDTASALFFWFFFYPSFAMVPMLYLLYVTFDIWRNKLLPSRGRRRQISLYYVRILVAVYVMWFPALVTIYGFSVGAWPFLYVGIWIHGQGAVSALCSLLKQDVFQAVKDLLLCRRFNPRHPRRPDGRENKARLGTSSCFDTFGSMGAGSNHGSSVHGSTTFETLSNNRRRDRRGTLSADLESIHEHRDEENDASDDASKGSFFGTVVPPDDGIDHNNTRHVEKIETMDRLRDNNDKSNIR